MSNTVLTDKPFQAAHFSRKLLAMGIASSLVLGASAQAQQRVALEEIFVTAQKTEQNIQDTPIAISAFSNTALDNLGIQDAKDLMQYTPGMHITRSRITIRGIGQEQTQLGSDPGVAIYYDGVYSADTTSLSVTDFWDVERIEVLRGPQGTLFGRNTVGGAINVISRAPTEQFSGAVEAELGDFGTQKLKFAAGGSIADNVQGRVSLFNYQRDGYQENINDDREFDERDTQGGQLSLNVQWTDNWETAFRLRGTTSDYAPPATKVEDAYDTTTVLYGSGAINPNFGRIVANPFPGDDTKADINPESPMNRRLDDYTFTMDNNWYVDAGEIKYIASYGQRRFKGLLDVDKSGSDVYSNIIERTDDDTETQTHELQFVSDWDGDFNINTGLYYYNEKAASSYGFYDTVDMRYSRTIDQIDGATLDTIFDFLIATPGNGVNSNACVDATTVNCATYAAFTASPTNSVSSAFLGLPEGYTGDPLGLNSTYWTDVELESTSYAAFGQLDWDYSDDLRITIGLRYSEDEKEGVETNWAYTERFASLVGVPTILAFGNPELAFPELGQTGGRAANYYYATTGTSNGFGFPVAGGLTNEKVSDSWSSVSGKIGFDYTIDVDQMVYGSISTGYRSGGFALGSNFSSPIPTVDPEELLAYEVGYKGDLADGRVRINAALYFYDYQDLQLRNQVLDGTGLVLPVLTNAAGAETYGLDFEGSWLVTDKLLLEGTFSYLNAEYTDYESIDTLADDYDPANPVVQDLDGFKLNRSPEIKYSLAATYMIDTGMGPLDLIASYSWTDEMYHSQFNTSADITPDFERIDVRARWSSVDELWAVTAYVNNVNDDRTPQSNFVDTPENGGYTFVGLGAPRVYGLIVRRNF